MKRDGREGIEMGFEGKSREHENNLQRYLLAISGNVGVSPDIRRKTMHMRNTLDAVLGGKLDFDDGVHELDKLISDCQQALLKEVDKKSDILADFSIFLSQIQQKIKVENFDFL